MGSRAVPGSITSNNQPIIKASDVFGAAGPDNHGIPLAHMSGFLDSSSEDDNEMLELSIQNTPDIVRAAGRGHAHLMTSIERLNRQSAEATKRDASSQKLSAILVDGNRVSQHANPFFATGYDDGYFRYLPLCPASTTMDGSKRTNSALLTVLPSQQETIQHSIHQQANAGATWPLDELPVELFDLITAQLSRDDVKTMRLVNREFERKVSRSLFHTSVVPFNTELYDMIDEDKKSIGRASVSRHKGKGKLKAIFSDPLRPLSETDAGALHWQNAKEDKEGKVYKGHGLRVFQGFGPHIKRFGMSFEVLEKQLAHPPIKKELDHVESYHGTYDWPSVYYARFANLAGLENTADETSRMKAAFSKLEIVRELALSIDNGLGWLNGPDKSVRGRIFERPSAVFGSAYDVPDRSMRAASEFWNALQQSQHSFAPESNLKEINLEHRALPSRPSDLDGLRDTICSDTQHWSSIDAAKVGSSRSPITIAGFGVLYTTTKQQESADLEPAALTLIPSQLRKEQKEWLLETQWAQQAFLESYMLAIIDNPVVFGKVTTLTVAKLSSQFLPMLARQVLWNALPCLSDVTLHVSPDWRTVEKDDAGMATTKSQNPSEAVRVFHKDVLRDRVSLKESIKKLNIGWFGGGENAEGMHARNANILPAPITQLDHSTANSSVFGLVFKYVEHLTLSNCWITPPTLEGLVKSHSSKVLKKITLNSVSLTAHPRFPPANGQGGGVQQLAQAMVAMQAQLANNDPAAQNQQVAQQPQLGFAQQLAQLGPGFLHGLQGLNAQQLAVMQQHWNQHMQQMQQLFNANPNQLNVAQNALVQNVAALNGAQAPPVLAPNAHPPTSATPRWTQGHREGSWPLLLDILSPGVVFDDYLPPPAPWDEPLPPRPETNLQSIEFSSCGYAKLPNHNGFDQLVLEPDLAHVRPMSQWFRSRWSNLKSLMLETRDRNLGQIVQFMPQHELDALQFAWGLTEGWSDRTKAEEAEYDGFLPSGTGRFSGVVERGMALVGQPDSPAAPPIRTA